jgi:hypothetical protein
MSFPETLRDNKDFVPGLLVKMGSVDKLLSLISVMLFLLGGCVILLGVSFTASTIFLLLTAVTNLSEVVKARVTVFFTVIDFAEDMLTLTLPAVARYCHFVQPATTFL